MAKQGSSHEDFQSRQEIKVGSERAFGLVFAGVFLLVGLAPLYGGGSVRYWALGLAAAFVLAAFVFPKVLKPLNIVWFKFGLLLHKVVNPVIMGLLFFLTVTPMALIMKVLGKDPMHRKLDPKAKTYWIDREPPGPAPETLKRQF